MHEPLEHLIPVGWMAKRLHVSPKWLLEEAIQGRVPALKAGDKYLFNPAAVEAALVKRAVGTVT